MEMNSNSLKVSVVICRAGDWRGFLLDKEREGVKFQKVIRSQGMAITDQGERILCVCSRQAAATRIRGLIINKTYMYGDWHLFGIS